MISDDEIDMYTRVFTKEPQYGPVVDIEGSTESEDKDEQDFRLIRNVLNDMLYYYSHKYQNKKEDMIRNMTQMAKMMGDLNIRRLIAHCEIFPRILKEFDQILLKELETRSEG